MPSPLEGPAVPNTQSHLITDPKVMWVLASPARLEVLDAACALGECSAGEIAEMTGRSRTSLYPHIEHLVKASLLIESGTRPSGKRHEQLYRPIARQINTRHDITDPDNVAYHTAYGNAVCRQLARLFYRANRHPDTQPRGPTRDTHCGAQTCWVDDTTLAELNEHINRIWEICRHSEPGPGKRLLQFGIVTAPVHRGEQSDSDD